MKATVDIPEQLYRQVKASVALEGRAVVEVLNIMTPSGCLAARYASEPGT